MGQFIEWKWMFSPRVRIYTSYILRHPGLLICARFLWRRKPTTQISMHNLTITFVRRESNASLRLNIRLRSLIFAARRCDTVATLRRFLEGREALKEFI